MNVLIGNYIFLNIFFYYFEVFKYSYTLSRNIQKILRMHQFINLTLCHVNGIRFKKNF